MTRLQQILSAVLVLQIALAVWLNLPQQTNAAPATPLLGDLKIEDITAFTIDDGKDNVAALAKKGDQWVLSNGGDYPADADKIKEMLTKLLALKSGRIVTRTEVSHKQLQVAEMAYSKRVQLETSGKAFTLFLGTSPQGQTIHVRLKGQNEVYLCDGISNWEVGALPANWVDAKYLNYLESDISSLTLENKEGKFIVEKSQGGWAMEGLDKPFDQAKFSSLLRRLAPLNLSVPLGKEEKPEYGLSSPLATLSLKIDQKDAGSKMVTLKIGAKDQKSDSYFVKASDSDYYVKVNAVAVEEWVNTGRQDLVKQEPTPTPLPTQ